MDEARRFLRYVTPGYIYVAECALCLLIVFPDWTAAQLTSVAANNNLGLALTSVFVSGAFGYVFAAVHHWCHWTIDRGVLDHSSMVNELIEAGEIPDQPKGQKVDRIGAFVIATSLWYQKVRANASNGESLDNKLISMSDITHGLGAARAATVFALLTTLAFCASIGTWSVDTEPILRFGLMLVFVGVLFCVFDNGYRNVGKLTKGYFERVLRCELTKPNESKGSA